MSNQFQIAGHETGRSAGFVIMDPPTKEQAELIAEHERACLLLSVMGRPQPLSIYGEDFDRRRGDELQAAEVLRLKFRVRVLEAEIMALEADRSGEPS